MSGKSSKLVIMHNYQAVLVIMHNYQAVLVNVNNKAFLSEFTGKFE